ncbi:NRDE-2, necessary for RNA interference-domain-containing protein [Parasitella parasitica]|nr:NRDE-2, necessary for RNA interference-domain-containing protein [Parasitella parasitica]
MDSETYAASGVDYRSLEGNKVKRSKTDQDREEDEDDENENEQGESFNDQIRQRTIDFNRKLDQTPENVQLWLDFIRFQDEAAAGLDPSAATNKTNKSSLNEVKLSIFEKALDHNPTDEELIYEYLRCGAETWETLKLLREWDTMLKQHPDSIRLWAEYINLRQTNFASFSYTQCVQVFEDALSILKRQVKSCSQEGNYEQLEDIESLMVYILLRACLFIKQSGYQEKAFAIIQAAVEFNLYQPVNFNTGRVQQQLEEKSKAFVEFWDSEVLRFGEEGALGWHEYFRATDNGEEVPDAVFDKPSAVNDDDENEVFSLKDWLASEVESERKNRMPLRMSQAEDDSVDDDPYRIVLSDDIKPFLFNTTTNDARQSLIYSIFVFIGLPYTPPQVGTNTHFFTDAFTHNEMPLNNFWPADQNGTKHLVWYVSGVPMNPEQTTSEMNPYYIPGSFPVGLNELFAKSGDWFKCAGKEYIRCDIDEKFTRQVSLELNRGRQLAKSLLKDQRNSLTLWNAYAQMEKSHSRLDELEMENSRPHEALKILVSMSSNQPYSDQTPPPTSTSILKTREYFTQKLAQLSTLSQSQSERHIAINMVGCSALFEYLSSGLDSACLVYQHALDYIKDRQAERGYEAEVVWIDYATLLYRHATTNTSYKPGLLRQAMEHALALFPNNTIFLAFYIWNESKTKIYNRVQHLLNDAVKNICRDSNVILWLSAIYSELHKYTPYHVNSVRDYLERSTQDSRTKASILLWKCYIQFELLQNNTQRARSLFYRSIRECPWSKELYMLGIKSFGTNMDEKEANELIRLLMEKEIRLRTPIDEDLLT